VRRLACLLLVLGALAPLTAAAATPVDGSVAFLLSREQADGGFAEPGRQSTPGLSAWAVLALEAAGHPPDAKALAYLHAQSGGSAADLDLRALALTAAGEDAGPLLDRIAADAKADGTIGGYVNSTAWGVLALRSAGRAVPAPTVPHLLAAQSANGGWSWSGHGAGDADDTAAVVEALRAAGQPAASSAIQRALAFLRRCHTKSGGFAPSPGGTPNAQTSAWAIQAFAAAGASPGKRALAYLARLRRSDGSYRYAPTLAVTPVWVTSEVVPALLRKPFPLRRPNG
jgi:Prenyltransferase and squalene oxidase repeat